MAVYYTSATIQTRIWGAIIRICPTESSSVASCTRAIVTVHLILKKKGTPDVMNYFKSSERKQCMEPLTMHVAPFLQGFG